MPSLSLFTSTLTFVMLTWLTAFDNPAAYTSFDKSLETSIPAAPSIMYRYPFIKSFSQLNCLLLLSHFVWNYLSSSTSFTFSSISSSTSTGSAFVYFISSSDISMFFSMFITYNACFFISSS